MLLFIVVAMILVFSFPLLSYYTSNSIVGTDRIIADEFQYLGISVKDRLTKII